MAKESATPSDSKRRLVLRTIHESDGVALTDISKRTGLKTAIVKHHVDQLRKEGMVRKRGSVRQGRGRPTELLGPNPRSGFLVGVDMDPSRVTAVITDMTRQIIATLETPLDRQAVHTELVAALADAAKRVIAGAKVPDQRVRGIGIALTGFYDRDAGVAVMSSSLPRWRNVPVRYMLEEALDYPVIIDDSVTAATLAERWFGKGIGVRNFLSLRVRTGISLGVVINGELYRGLGNAGTVNNLYVLPRDGALALSQPRTLFETASGHAMLEGIRQKASAQSAPVLWDLLERDLERITLETIVEATRRQDPLCVSTLCDAAQCWGRALAQAAELLHPQRAVVTGTFAELADLLKPRVIDSLNEAIFPPLRGRVEIEFSELGKLAGALGAAAMVLRDVIQSH